MTKQHSPEEEDETSSFCHKVLVVDIIAQKEEKGAQLCDAAITMAHRRMMTFWN